MLMAAVAAGAFITLFDPIFQGLAISLTAGEIISLPLSQMTLPTLYYLDAPGKREAAETAGDFSEFGDSAAENRASAEIEVDN